MFCPKCAYDYTKVSGIIKKEKTNERLRLCLNPECNYSFLTIEASRSDSFWKEYVRRSNEENSNDKNQ